MRIVMLSHTGRSSVFRVGSHHLARELSGLGHQVVHISNPISVAHLVMVRDREVRRRARMAVPLKLHALDGAYFAVPWSAFPLTPDPIRRPLTLGSTRLLVRVLAAAGLTEPDLMLIDQPLLDYLIDPIGPRKVVYRPTDIHLDPLVRAAEERLMQRAAGVVATSQVVADHLSPGFPGHPYRVVENGVETEHFTHARTAWAERRGAVFVGALDHRFDWAMVGALARAEPDQRLDIFGPGGADHPGLPGNVRCLGPVDYHRLPTVLGDYRVGLLPLNDEVTNSGRSPMKLYEYLAAGLNVLTRWTAPTSARGLHDIYFYRTPDSAPPAFRRALSEPPSGDGAAAAADMDWSARADLVLRACADMSS